MNRRGRHRRRMLVVSQFTLAADAGRQPPRLQWRGLPSSVRRLYERFGRGAQAASAGRVRRVRRRHAGAPDQRRPGDHPRSRCVHEAAPGGPWFAWRRRFSRRTGPGGLDDRAPLRDLGGDELLVLRTVQAGVGDHHRAQRFLALDEFGSSLQRGLAALLSFSTAPAGVPLGAYSAVPDGHVEALQALAVQRRQLGQRRRRSALGVVTA